jgi:signal transduction histidine kinase
LFDQFESVEIDHYVFYRPSHQAEYLTFVHLSSVGEVPTEELAIDSAALRTGLYNENNYKRSDVEFIWIAKPTPEFFKVRRGIAPWLVLGGGLLLFGMILSYIAFQINRLALLQQFAAEQAITNEKLSEANRELDAFVHTVAHDLRTPITPIMGYAEILRENYKDQLDEEGLSYLSKIEKAGTGMLSLMEGLLSLAKSGAIKRPVKCVSTDEVVARVIKNLEPNISAAGVVLRINPLPSIHVPKAFLIQIFDNLIGNAIRYAGNIGGLIEVGGEQTGKQIRFFVRDHGPGISEQERKHIFEIFYRGTNKGKVKGSGIGLAIVYKIARNCGGRAWVEETHGGGCTLWVEMEDETQD